MTKTDVPEGNVNATVDNEVNSSEDRMYTKAEHDARIAERQAEKDKRRAAESRIAELESMLQKSEAKKPGNKKPDGGIDMEALTSKIIADLAPKIEAKMDNDRLASKNEKIAKVIDAYRDSGIKEAKISKMIQDFHSEKLTVPVGQSNVTLNKSSKILTNEERNLIARTGMTEAELRHYQDPVKGNTRFNPDKKHNIFGAKPYVTTFKI